jgi:hypothetical protein
MRSEKEIRKDYEQSRYNVWLWIQEASFEDVPLYIVKSKVHSAFLEIEKIETLERILNDKPNDIQGEK